MVYLLAMAGADQWERFAREDPLFFIETDPAKRGSIDDFRAAGRGMVAWAMGLAGPALVHGRALEIGCGLGRTTVALAEVFEHVDGVDIAPTMVARAQAHGLPGNVHLAVTPGDGRLEHPDDSVDFVFSHLVLQHVPEEQVIARYLSETGRVLRGGGRGLLQLDTRRPSLSSQMLHALPDRLLPRRARRHIRRVRRAPDRIDQLVASAGLQVVEEHGRATDAHWLLLAAG